ncbi:MAG: virginiamycin lyase [Gaiellaceae bacterium]|jgi:streptogramin lyase|nr:virginiamycin lyase [Gaiellaceae bacterium]
MGDRGRRSAGVALVTLLLILGIGATAQSATGVKHLAAAPTITLKRVSGAVFVRAPDSTTFTSLSGSRRVAVGTEVEASNGRISITASSGQHGDFYQGRFIILVPPSQPSVLELDLSGSSFKNCRQARAFTSGQDPPPRRRLWGHAKGKFLTRGRYSVTSVRGTTWLTTDSCAGTVARVTAGTISVADLLRNKQVLIRRGKSYLSKAPIEYAIPTGNSEPTSVVAGPDGNLWFTEAAGKIGRSTPRGSIIEFPVLAPDQGEEGSSTPEVIVAGPDKNLWFTDAGASTVDRITTAGAITAFPVSGAPHGLTVGPDGNLWFTEENSMLGRITPAGAVSEIELPLEFPSDADRITAGADGNLWFVESSANKIGRVTLGGALTEFVIPTPDSSPAGITRGPDGNVWFTELSGGKVGKITPAGAITEYPVPGGPDAGLDQITVGPDGNLWVTEGGASQLARITPSGRVVEVSTPTDQSAPAGITAGPKGTIWFTETDGNSLGCARC